MKQAVFASVAVALALAAGEAKAQLPIPLSVEGRLDYALPVRDFDDLADEGTSWSVGASVGVTPGVGVYGTYSRTEFELALIPDAEVQDAGFSAGLTASLPTLGTGIVPWVGAGVVLHQLEFDAEDGDADEGVDEDIGFEVGGGLAVPLARNIRLTPGIGYRQYGVELNARPISVVDFDVTYVTAGVGLNISF